jgi:hypothetical protein
VENGDQFVTRVDYIISALVTSVPLFSRRSGRSVRLAAEQYPCAAPTIHSVDERHAGSRLGAILTLSFVPN